MLRIGRPKVTPAGTAKVRAAAGVFVSGAVIVGFGMAGCSADITRFNGLGVSGNQAHDTARPHQFDQTLFDQQPAADDPALATPYGRGTTGSIGRVESQRLADAAPRPANHSYSSDRIPPRAAPTSYNRGPYRPSQPETSFQPTSVAPPSEDGRATTITVQSGDTLYQLARRYGTTVASIKQANGLTGNIIRPGQQLVMSGTRTRSPTPVARAIAPEASYTNTQTRDIGSAGGTYTVRPGDSLYGIARRTGVRVATLKQLNDIRDVRRVMPGTVLRLEGDQQSPTSDQSLTAEPQRTPRFSEEPRTRRVGTTPIIINPSVGQQGAKPPVALNSPESRIDNGNSGRPQAGKRYARTEVPVSTSTADPAGKLRWPLSGRIIRGFGKRSDGSQNDGINIAVPVGTDIHAAESGVVAYAGNELKGYGNLILIRHDNGYVTAYAHGDRMLVRRGDAVRRGQVIAKAGKTGSVSQPQLHFELRKGAKPVDPIPYLSRRL